MTIRTAADALAPSLPLAVRAAQQRAATYPPLWGQPTALLHTTQLLVAFTSLDEDGAPQRALRFARDKLAAPLECSVRTIDRLIGRLAALGLVTRLPRRRRHGPAGSYWDCSRVEWTDTALAAFFARESGKRGPKVSTDAQTALPCPTRSACAQPTSMPSTAQPALAEAPAAAQLDLRRRIPAELAQWGERAGVRPASLVYLMALARSAKVWLQDVLEVCEQRFTGSRALRGRDAVGWLKTVIASGQDFAWAARQARQAREQQARTNAICAHHRTVGARLLAPGTVLPNGARVDGFAGETRVRLVLTSGVTTTADVGPLVDMLEQRHAGWVAQRMRSSAAPDLSPAPASPSAAAPTTVQAPCLAPAPAAPIAAASASAAGSASHPIPARLPARAEGSLPAAALGASPVTARSPFPATSSRACCDAPTPAPATGPGHGPSVPMARGPDGAARGSAGEHRQQALTLARMLARRTRPGVAFAPGCDAPVKGSSAEQGATCDPPKGRLSTLLRAMGLGQPAASADRAILDPGQRQ